jgi:hypothetical protein
VALGAGALASGGSGDEALQAWVAGAVVADAADLAATLAAGDSLPLFGRAFVGSIAAGGAALGVVALLGLRRTPA